MPTEPNLVTREGASKPEIGALAVIFAGNLAGEDPKAIRKAFDLHRKKSRRFPAPCRHNRHLAGMPCSRRDFQGIAAGRASGSGMGEGALCQLEAAKRKGRGDSGNGPGGYGVSLRFTLPLRPTGQMRPRFSGGIAYKHKSWKAPEAELDGPLVLSFSARMPIPASRIWTTSQSSSRTL